MPAPGQDVRTVVGKYLDFHGRAMGGTVTFTPTTPIENITETFTVLPDEGFVAELDSAGAFSIALPITNDPDFTTQNWPYTVKENLTYTAGSMSGKTWTRPAFNILVPSIIPDAPLELGTVAPVPAVGSITLVKGDKGDPGDNAYQVAVSQGFSGTLSEWLASLQGSDGTLPYNLTVSDTPPVSPSIGDLWVDTSS